MILHMIMLRKVDLHPACYICYDGRTQTKGLYREKCKANHHIIVTPAWLPLTIKNCFDFLILQHFIFKKSRSPLLTLKSKKKNIMQYLFKNTILMLKRK